MENVIFHIDVNSAFLSWEAVYRLKNGGSVDLREIPSAVGGDKSKRRGIILAKSIPAKAISDDSECDSGKSGYYQNGMEQFQPGSMHRDE